MAGSGKKTSRSRCCSTWERELAKGGWLGIDYPKDIGGRECSLSEQVIFFMTYVEVTCAASHPQHGRHARRPDHHGLRHRSAKAPLHPEDPLAVDEMWCQGYSEPNAGSDLANVQAQGRARRRRMGHQRAEGVDFARAVLRNGASSCAAPMRNRNATTGCPTMLVPMDQPGIEIRPIVQITGGAEFNEVFFTDARTRADMVVGEVGRGWEVAMGTLGFERGASTLGQQLAFRREFDDLVNYAKKTGAADDPIIRQELAEMYGTLEIMRYSNLRMLTVVDAGGVPGPEMSIGKLLLVELAPAPRRGDGQRDGGGRARCWPGRHGVARAGRGGLPAGADAAHVPLLAGAHDLRRVERDPAQRDRRARARPAE